VTGPDNNVDGVCKCKVRKYATQVPCAPEAQGARRSPVSGLLALQFVILDMA